MITREELDKAIVEATDNLYNCDIIMETLESYKDLFADVLTDNINKKKFLLAYEDLSYALSLLER